MNEEVKCVWCDRSGASRVGVRRKDEEAAEEGRATSCRAIKTVPGSLDWLPRAMGSQLRV